MSGEVDKTADGLSWLRMDGAHSWTNRAAIGRQSNDDITLAEIAARHKMSMNLVPMTIGPRVVRVYRRNV